MAHEQQQRCIAFGWPSSEWFCLCCLKFIKSNYQRERVLRSWAEIEILQGWPNFWLSIYVYIQHIYVYIYVLPIYNIYTYIYFHNLIYSFQGHGEKSLCSQHSKGLPRCPSCQQLIESLNSFCCRSYQLRWMEGGRTILWASVVESFMCRFFGVMKLLFQEVGGFSFRG